MSLTRLEAGFVPLVDAAPLILAQRLGFAEEEGLDLRLRAAPSWSALRDMLAFGQIEAAHLLSPMPVAMTLGLGGVATAIDALQVLSVGGSVIGVSSALDARLRAAGHGFDFADARAAGRALLAAAAAPGAGPLRVGVPFPFSMHAALLGYWMRGLADERAADGAGDGAGDGAAAAADAPPRIEVRTVPPPRMAQALRDGEIDAFCVGEPWGSIAVDMGVASLLLPTVAIWSFPPEKVLAVRRGWAEAAPQTTGGLMRAVWRAGRWLAEPGNTTTAAEILSQRDGIDVAPGVVDRALHGRLVISARGEERVVPGFQHFFQGAATFPWRSQAAWIATQLAQQSGRDAQAARRAAADVFRSDLYRQHLGRAGALLPSASAKLEGALPEALVAELGAERLILARNVFFDGAIFDPEAP